MFLKYLVYSTVCAITFGQGIIFRPQPPAQQPQQQQPPQFNNRNNFQRLLTPPRAMTTLNTFVPRQLIPPAPPSAAVVRFFDRPRIYTAPLTLPRVQPAPAFRRYPNNATFVLDTNTNNPRYAFNYGVADNRVISTSNYRWCEVFTLPFWDYFDAFIIPSNLLQTGDFKSQREQLENGVVTGEYSLRDADGSLRRVTYRADDRTGFNAIVERINDPNNNRPPPSTDPLVRSNQQFRIFAR